MASTNLQDQANGLAKFLSLPLIQVRIEKMSSFAGFEIWDSTRGICIGAVGYKVIYNIFHADRDIKPVLDILRTYSELMDVWEGRTRMIYG